MNVEAGRVGSTDHLAGYLETVSKIYNSLCTVHRLINRSGEEIKRKVAQTNA